MGTISARMFQRGLAINVNTDTMYLRFLDYKIKLIDVISTSLSHHMIKIIMLRIYSGDRRNLDLRHYIYCD